MALALKRVVYKQSPLLLSPGTADGTGVYITIKPWYALTAYLAPQAAETLDLKKFKKTLFFLKVFDMFYNHKENNFYIYLPGSVRSPP